MLSEILAFFDFSPVVQRIEWEFPKLLIRVRFSAGLLNPEFANYWKIIFLSLIFFLIKNDGFNSQQIGFF